MVVQQQPSAGPQFENQIGQLLAGLRRRRWPFLLALACGVLLTVFVALVWPATYRSTATIYVEPPDVTADTDLAEDLPARQIARVTQRVMTTENLAPLLRETGLYADSGLSVIERVESLQQHFTLDQVTAESLDARGRPTETVVTFSLSFDDAEANLAQRVVGRLVTLYLSENVEIRRSRFAERARFLGNEAA
ncbi:MAG: Wzz/FepE/Etk N-terminal domain-containing protein, partial [Pseudomonadota bacterium]